MFTLAECKNLHSLSQRCAYNEVAKAKFRRLARKLMKEVADLTSLGGADLRWNEGGIAVSGEATLHADTMYVQVSEIDLGILYRTCKSRKDYSGGTNHWYPWRALEANGVEGLAVAIRFLQVQQGIEAGKSNLQIVNEAL